MGTPQSYRPSFFKVMVGDFTKKLRIPVDFVQNFNGIEPVESILRNPSGECWSINVKRVEENLFFREGWPEFVIDNSLEFGDFLVMKYIGNSQFDVKIYGSNGCEKELTLTNEDKIKPISLEKKEKGQTTKSKFSNCHTEFEHKFHEGNMTRDSVSSDEKICGSCKCVEPKKRAALDNERTAAAAGSSSIKKKRPFFISTWMKKKKYQLELPKTFVRKVGDELSDFVVLKDAVRKDAVRFWSIGLRKAEGRVWFEKGWQEFTTHHSITCQHILRFDYYGNSLFYVVIVNTNAAEMAHLKGSGHTEEPRQRCHLTKMDEKGEEDEVVVLAAPPFPFPSDSRKEIIDGNTDQTMKSKAEPTLARNQLQVREQQSKEKNKNELRKEFIDENSDKRTKSKEQPSLARNPLQVREQSKGKNKIESRKEIIGGHAGQTTNSKEQLTLARNPIQVCEQSKEKNKNESRKEIIHGNAGQTMKSKDQQTLAGNPLQVCEQSREKNKNVSTYKRRDRSPSPSKRPHKKKSSEDGRKKRDIFDLDKSNQIKQRSGDLTADFNGGNSIRCHNPIKTSQKKINEVKEIPITKMDKAQSSVPSGKDVGMQLNAGELMKSSTSAVARREQSSGKVSSPSQGNEKTPAKSVVKREEDSDSSEPPTAKKSSYSSSSKTPGNERASQVANAFKSKYPFFTVVLRESYLSKGYLHIPNSFAREHMPNGKSITLRGSDKKKWTVEYCVRGPATQLASGWSNFTRELDLKEEDVCVLELIEKKHTEMKISIFRQIKDKLTEVWPIKENAS